MPNTESPTSGNLLAAAVAGTATCLVLLRGHGRLVRALRRAIEYCRNPLRHQTVQICNTFEECRLAVCSLQSFCADYPVLGFDCEWVTINTSRRPVALLQLAAPNGYCALIRISQMRSAAAAAGSSASGFPAELRELLANSDIIKVGVVPADDAHKLARDYGLCVASTLDLRHMARAGHHRPLGLAKMSLEHLQVEMDKDWRISCSNWEAAELSERQIDYAAKDALVAVELFRHFAGHRGGGGWWRRRPPLAEILQQCVPYLDVVFSVAAVNSAAPRSAKWVSKGKTGGTKRAMSTRASPLYENCLLQAPDGQLLCTCDRKKAEWYVTKNIGDKVADEPLTVRLRFEPAGRAVGEVGKFYQQEKENRCVVCGQERNYQRKNIIPREYRKYFPPIMKDHTSHDVLLLCTDCHQRSNMSDLRMRQRLADLAGAPFTVASDGSGASLARTVENPELRKLKSAAKALYFNAAKIPAERIEQLRTEIHAQLPADSELNEEKLRDLATMDTHEPNDNYSVHGEQVVAYFQAHSDTTGGLVELERMWRTHFLSVMQPRFLPPLWSVEHNVDRLEIRVAENRITDNELTLSGLNRQTVESSA